MASDLSTRSSDDPLPTCDRCGDEIGPLEPATNILFSGGVDGLRTACHDCMTALIETWNEGDAVDAGRSDRSGGGDDAE
jgi:hypothetical protein